MAYNIVHISYVRTVVEKSLFQNETSYSAMLHAMRYVKSCNVKYISESVFRYFASAVNSN